MPIPFLSEKGVCYVVGDVHGDFNQFLAPLVLSGLISITDSVKEYQR